MLWQITEFTVCLYRWESGLDFPFVLLSTLPLSLCFMYAWKRSLEYLLLNQSRFTCLHDQNCTYSLYIHFHLSLNILKKSVPPQPTTFHCPNKPTENHIFLSPFFSPPCLSLNPNVITFYLTQLLQAEATLRECAQHLSPSCC